MTLIFFLGGGVGGEEVRWKTVRTYGKILATPLKVHLIWQWGWRYGNSKLEILAAPLKIFIPPPPLACRVKKSGRLEDWKTGRLEDWKTGRDTIPEVPARLFEQQELGNEITRFDAFLSDPVSSNSFSIGDEKSWSDDRCVLLLL